MSNNESPNVAPNVKSNPIVAAMLSLIFFGGGGQIYLGQIKKGVLLIAIALMLFIFQYLSTPIDIKYIFTLLFSPVVYIMPILGSLDAFILAKKLKKGQTIGEWMFFWGDIKVKWIGLIYITIGFIGWLVMSWIVNMNILDYFGMYSYSQYTVIYILLSAVQVTGIVLAVFMLRSNKRKIGIGILWASALYLIGLLIRNTCAPPGFPFPISFFSFC